MSKQSTSDQNKENEESKASVPVKKMCGIIMPIADTLGYDNAHWKDVLNILEDALKETEFEAKLVSERLDIGLIHEEIVKNIYENEIVICDVSSKNPNVMFELGMRLAFDKPTIIIKDEKTNYSFDIGGILHLDYPSSLRHNKIEKFKTDLCKHLEATHKKATSDSQYSPFLKSFGRHIVAKTIEKSEISESQYIIEKLQDISTRLMFFEKKDSGYMINTPKGAGRTSISMALLEKEIIKNILNISYSINDLEKIITDDVTKKNIITSLLSVNGISVSMLKLTDIIAEIIGENF